MIQSRFHQFPDEESEIELGSKDVRNGLVPCEVMIEGLDNLLFDKLTVVKGSLHSFANNEKEIALVIQADNYGNPIIPKGYPSIGETISIQYMKDSSEETVGSTIDYIVNSYVIVPKIVQKKLSNTCQNPFWGIRQGA